MVVHSKRGVAVGSQGVVQTEKTLLKHDCFGLKLNCLQEVTELELNARNLRDAACGLSVHRSSDLQKHVDCLRVEFESTVQRVLLVRLLGLLKQHAHIVVRDLQVFHNPEKFADVIGLERQVFVVAYNFLL